MTDHLLNACVKFKAETRENKLNFVKNRNPPMFTRLLHDPSVSTSMIVPVWLSSLLKPDNEVQVYAILDKQTAATFILKGTGKELDTETQPTKLQLSTITSQDSFVDSQLNFN